MSPDVAEYQLSLPVERTLLETQQRLLTIRDTLSRASALHREEHHGASAFRLLRGTEVIFATLRKLNDSCRYELQAVQPGGPRPPEVLRAVRGDTLNLLRRGVRHRAIYQHSVRTHEASLAFMAETHAEGSRFRTLGALFERVLVYDRTIAVLPDHRYERAQHALLIDHPGVAGFLAGVFDHTWEYAEPVDLDPSDTRPDPLTDAKQRAVLRLMVEGYTDATIATRLGMSARTVANHIKKASEELGSRSRAQLAYLIAKTSYLDGVD
ncbi:LuxR C-terminal-related transcriptional regulator [Streptomyces kanasensis]|uniref:helix-turn-helix transcriptional regulator n=1 Tax=Streptomyces kanasensis TaxID=936756 RepID=UPI0036FAB480